MNFFRQNAPFHAIKFRKLSNIFILVLNLKNILIQLIFENFDVEFFHKSLRIS